jgi:hypothetical protein
MAVGIEVEPGNMPKYNVRINSPLTGIKALQAPVIATAPIGDETQLRWAAMT